MGKSQYIIQFGGLPVGLHDYEFDVNETFFKNFESSEVDTADLNVKAVLTKQNNLLQMHVVINGTVGLDCDRCMKNFNFPINTEENLVIKHGNPEESTDEILVIPEGTEEFEIAHYIYEYITLAIPARRVPCELDENLFKCDEEMLEKLDALSSSSADEEEIKNPMWEKLSKLKKINKN